MSSNTSGSNTTQPVENKSTTANATVPTNATDKNIANKNTTNTSASSETKSTSTAAPTNVTTKNTANSDDSTKSPLPQVNAYSMENVKNTFKEIFSASNILLIIWVLAIYFIASIVIGLFTNTTTGPALIIRIIDAFIMVLALGYFLTYYYNTPESKRDEILHNLYDSTYVTVNDPYTLVYTGVILVLYYAIVFLFHIPTSGVNAPMTLGIIITIVWLFFEVTAIVVFFNDVLGISILGTTTKTVNTVETTAKNIANGTTNAIKNTVQNVEKVIISKDEVFNIGNNLYTYDDAKAVCSAYGSRLATYDEIEDAYNNGAEWCNYGWSDNQMAYFPTQKNTWNELQKNPSQKNNCGRPGVNGGYMANPYIKFGVNCYGKKPKPTDKDLLAMQHQTIAPKSSEDIIMEKKVQFWKDNADKMLKINSFNKTAWSEY